jgi:hypothetical protein
MGDESEIYDCISLCHDCHINIAHEGKNEYGDEY